MLSFVGSGVASLLPVIQRPAKQAEQASSKVGRDPCP